MADAKVLEVLSHINKRVKGQSAIKLPLRDLVQQYMAPDASPFVQNLNIVYLGLYSMHPTAAMEQCSHSSFQRWPLSGRVETSKQRWHLR